MTKIPFPCYVCLNKPDFSRINIFLALASISSERSTAVTSLAINTSHSVFFPVPQPISKHLKTEKCCKHFLSATASRSLVLLLLVSYWLAQILYASFTFIQFVVKQPPQKRNRGKYKNSQNLSPMITTCCKQ